MRVEGIRGKQRGAGTGSGEAAEDVCRRLGFGQRAEQTARGQPVGQAGGKLEQDLGAADEEQRQVGRSVGREIEQEPQGVEGGDRFDQVGVVDDQERALASGASVASWSRT